MSFFLIKNFCFHIVHMLYVPSLQEKIRFLVPEYLDGTIQAHLFSSCFFLSFFF